MFVLKHGVYQTPLGLIHKTNEYAVCFNTMKLARKFKYSIESVPTIMSLERVACDSFDASEVVGGYMHGIKLPSINMDKKSILHVQKGAAYLCDYYMHQMDVDKVIVMPLEASVGLVMPIECIAEDVETMSFRCHVVDPIPAKRSSNFIHHRIHHRYNNKSV